MRRPATAFGSTLAAFLAAVALVGCGASDTGVTVTDVLDATGIDAVGSDVQPGDVTDDDTTSEVTEYAGVTAVERDGVVLVDGGVVQVRFTLATGLFRVEAASGAAVLDGAEARAVLLTPSGPLTLGTSSLPERTWRAVPADDELGAGLRLLITTRGDTDPRLDVSIWVRRDATFVTSACTVIWEHSTPVDVRVEKLSPLVADEATSGALFLGDDPAAHRVLDDGYDLYFDFEARVYPVGRTTSLFFPPGSASNWNVGVLDPASKRSVVAGFLSSNRGVGVVGLDYEAGKARSEGSRRGFTRFDGLAYYKDGRTPLIDDDGDMGLLSERFYLDLVPPDVFAGLEDFGTRYAQRIGKAVWTDVPSGWNSWGGGHGSGGLGQDIDEALMLENLDAAATDFRPRGMRYFLIDDGWQAHAGDWVGHPQRFPAHDGVEGMQWMADRIRERDMIPGLWIAPFYADPDSALVAEHPDWFVELWGPAIGLAGDKRVLDLSRPEVLDWLSDLFHKVAVEWGYKWIKVDFTYYEFGAIHLADPDVTPSEAYRNALLRIREAVGPDTFFLMISATGMCLEMADGNRITLDNEPMWGDPESAGDQGIKVTYRTVAHRYYLNHTAWLNHPDLLFFRDDYGLTLDQSRAWASVVALTGGIVKLGEPYTVLHEHPEWRAVVNPLLPVYPHTGRPLDLFEREYPEVWLLPVRRGAEAWHVLGLFNWGLNRDVTATEMEPEAERTVGVDRAALGLVPGDRVLLFDAWAETWAWSTADRFEATLAPRTTRVLVVRLEPSEPRVVFTSRHLLGGAVEVLDEGFEPVEKKLSFSLTTVPGDLTRVYVALAGQQGPVTADVSGAQGLQVGTTDGLAVLQFTATDALSSVIVDFE